MLFDFDMGKYAFFVWGAYGATALGLVGLVVATLRTYTETKKRLSLLQSTITEIRK